MKLDGSEMANASPRENVISLWNGEDGIQAHVDNLSSDVVFQEPKPELVWHDETAYTETGKEIHFKGGSFVWPENTFSERYEYPTEEEVGIWFEPDPVKTWEQLVEEDKADFPSGDGTKTDEEKAEMKAAADSLEEIYKALGFDKRGNPIE